MLHPLFWFIIIFQEIPLRPNDISFSLSSSVHMVKYMASKDKKNKKERGYTGKGKVYSLLITVFHDTSGNKGKAPRFINIPAFFSSSIDMAGTK